MYETFRSLYIKIDLLVAIMNLIYEKTYTFSHTNSEETRLNDFFCSIKTSAKTPSKKLRWDSCFETVSVRINIIKQRQC